MGFTFVLVHSPLLPWTCWRPFASALDEKRCVIPRLPTDEEATAADHVAAVLDALPSSGEFCLVFHSGSGVLAGALVDRLGARAARLVFIDAMLPSPGASRLDGLREELAPGDFERLCRHLADGGLFPIWPDRAWEGQVRDPGLREEMRRGFRPKPLAYWAEPIPSSAAFRDLPALFVQCTETYAPYALAASALGWSVLHHPASHLGILDDPYPLAAAVLATLNRSAPVPAA